MFCGGSVLQLGFALFAEVCEVAFCYVAFGEGGEDGAEGIGVGGGEDF